MGNESEKQKEKRFARAISDGDMGYKIYLDPMEGKQIRKGIKTSGKGGKAKPVFLLSSVKGGSGKTYSSLALAFSISRIKGLGEKTPEDLEDISQAEQKMSMQTEQKVCVIDLDLSATNMRLLLRQIEEAYGGTDTDSPEGDSPKGVNLKAGKSIHEYIIHSASHRTKLDDYISTFTYQEKQGKEQYVRQIDFLLGNESPRYGRLFSANRINSYENTIPVQESRRLLFRMMDEVLQRDYQAIIIDMQPGMEGLCHAAIEYWSSSIGNTFAERGFFAERDRFSKYTPHLCFNSTGDWTQICTNIRWMLEQPETYHRIKNRHLIIKDNFGEIKDESVKEVEEYIRKFGAELDGKTRPIFQDLQKEGTLQQMIQSIMILRNNKRYTEFYGGAGGSTEKEIWKIYSVPLNPGEDEYPEMARWLSEEIGL